MFPAMDMKSYWQSLSAKGKDELAEALACNRTYLAQIACGARRASPKLARRIDEYSSGVCSKEALRPDVFGGSPTAA
jgi:DNA-binding transcriptional regulator YdaS (Cro superfamily)